MVSSHGHDAPLYNSRIIDTFIKLIRQRYTHVNVSELLTYAGMKSYEVADQGHWFTQTQVDRFYEKLVELSGNLNIAREAGQYVASPEAIGVMRQYLLGLIGPSNVFALLSQTIENFTRSSRYESRKLASNKVEITVVPRDGVCEKQFQCENRIGSWEGVVSLFDYDSPKVEHPECLFRGGKECRYVVTWQKTISSLLISIRNICCITLSILFLVFLYFSPTFSLETILPCAIVIILALTVAIQHKEKKELLTSLSNLKSSSDELLEQMNINYKNALFTNDIGQAISKQTSIDDVLSNLMHIFQKYLDYDRALILLADETKSRLEFWTGFGYTDDQLRLLKKTAFHLTRTESRGTFVVSFREQRAFLVNDFSEVEKSLTLHSLAFAKKLGSHSFICCPIVYENESLGILAVDNVQSKRALVQSDMSLLMGIAPVIGISIRNADLIRGKVQQFDSMLHVLAATIDARDSLTAGHSEKVTEYAVGICEELGITGDHREMIRVAALLHDYGKIGIPDSILKKEGKLTPAEFELVKSHASKTREILEQVNFEGIFKQVPAVAGAHHEKLDGTGYPQKLSGKEIPVGAKIIAVADFFEAITAKRHYREPMSLEIALGLLEQETGKHFDRRIVNALITYLGKNGELARRAGMN